MVTFLDVGCLGAKTLQFQPVAVAATLASMSRLANWSWPSGSTRWSRFQWEPPSLSVVIESGATVDCRMFASALLLFRMATSPQASAPLGLISAIFDALLNRDLDYYPRVDGPTGTMLLASRGIIKEFGEASEGWLNLTNDKALESALDLARDSLKEVKAQTEYQDQKATRLLTVTTFVLALAGALFTRLNDAYPIPALTSGSTLQLTVVILAYLGFGAFLVFSLFGALVTFHASRTRFKYQRDTSPLSVDEKPLSRLFFQGIISARPRAWSNAFVDLNGGTGVLPIPAVRADLQQQYLRDLVGETYLIACKTADKVRYLDPAQRLLATALKCLVCWIVVLAALLCFPHVKTVEPMQVKLVDPIQMRLAEPVQVRLKEPTQGQAPEPMQVRLVPPLDPIAVRIEGPNLPMPVSQAPPTPKPIPRPRAATAPKVRK